MSESEDIDIQEECLLACIALVLGGNAVAQETFYKYMMQDDPENDLLITIRNMLQQNFELTKKYLIEKNASLEMVFKIK